MSSNAEKLGREKEEKGEEEANEPRGEKDSRGKRKSSETNAENLVCKQMCQLSAVLSILRQKIRVYLHAK